VNTDVGRAAAAEAAGKSIYEAGKSIPQRHHRTYNGTLYRAPQDLRGGREVKAQSEGGQWALTSLAHSISLISHLAHTKTP
jgi:hypothetical protein